MPSIPIDEVKNEELRRLIGEAQVALDGDDYLTCVRRCVDAYLRLLDTHPPVMQALRAVLATESVRAGLETGTIHFAPVMWPRLAAKLRMTEDGTPTIVFDRERLSFTEAVQYLEFTLTLITDAEHGSLTSAPQALF